MPLGMAAVMKDSRDELRFVVWNGSQMHGDVGERMNLKKRLTASNWNALKFRDHSESAAPDTKRKKTQYWAFGDLCPKDYQTPPDWDVLGHLPPRKKAKTNDVPKSKPIQSSTDNKPKPIQLSTDNKPQPATSESNQPFATATTFGKSQSGSAFQENHDPIGTP